MTKKSAIVSLGDIAAEAGVSRVSVCYALRNAPGVSAATRKRIRAIADRLGYVPDARVASVMASVRNAKTKDPLPLAWVNNNTEIKSWHDQAFFSPYLEGAEERARQLGYRIDEFHMHAPGMSMKRLARLLFQRGIEGAIITYPLRHIRLSWEHLAGVSLEAGLLAPRLHRVSTDQHYNLLLAIKMLKRAGYTRIGICLEKEIGRYAANSVREAAHCFHCAAPKSRQVPPLFYLQKDAKGWPAAKEQIIAWVARHKPDAVIGHSNGLLEAMKEAGLRVPGDIGVVHLATDDDVADWAGVCSNRRQIGATATDLLVSLIRNREFGIPKFAVGSFIEGSWHGGRTLLVPKR